MENFDFKKYITEGKLLNEDSTYSNEYGAKYETLREIEDIVQVMSENYVGDDFNPEAARMLAAENLIKYLTKTFID